MAEILDPLAAKIDALSAQIDERFKQVDAQFKQVDDRLDQLESRVGVKIEAVRSLAARAVERLDDVLKRDVSNSAAHARMDTRIDHHDLRLLALERGQTSESS